MFSILTWFSQALVCWHVNHPFVSLLRIKFKTYLTLVIGSINAELHLCLLELLLKAQHTVRSKHFRITFPKFLCPQHMISYNYFCNVNQNG